MMIALLLTLAASSAHADSITDLPTLSKAMIHHYDCRLAYLPEKGNAQELTFQLAPTLKGHDSQDQTLNAGSEKILASVNSEMLSIVWTRGNLTVANSQSWIQKSTTQAQVLMVADPQNAGSQVHLSCNGITFDDVKRGVK